MKSPRLPPDSSGAVLSRCAVLALLLLVACLTGCNQQTLPSFRSTMSGVYDLALFGDDLLFVTSAANDELRVLDLKVDPRDFVRAPNPLQPLSIPVVPQPVGIVKDLHYDQNGLEVPGPYVYAHGAASAAISVVGADRSSLREVLRLNTQGNVTALAAHGPDNGRAFSTLYFATSSETSATLWSVDLPGLDQIGANPPTPDQYQRILELPGSYISVLAVMPALDQVVVATRKPGGTQGDTFILTITRPQNPGDSLQVQRLELQFPGPVRMVMANPQGSTGTPGLGHLVFGVLDEEACGAGTGCIGILAVDAATGKLANDSTGQPMLPIAFGQSLIQGMNFQPGAFVAINTVGGSAAYSLLGMGTTSSGEIFFFDAGALRQIDINPSAAAVGTITLRDANDTVQTSFTSGTTGPLNVTPQDGATRDETIRIVYQGNLPGTANLPVTFGSDGPHYRGVPAGLIPFVQANDFISVSSPSSSGCQTDLTVSSAAVGPDGQGEVYASSPLPAACGTDTVFSVRAGGSDPYVVTGDLTGFMGRTHPGAFFKYQGTSYYHPDGFNPSAPQLTFLMGQESSPLTRDWRYAITTVSNFQHLGFYVDTSLTTLAGYYLPGSIVHLPDQAIAFVAYPSANGLIEFNPPSIIPGRANASNIKSYP